MYRSFRGWRSKDSIVKHALAKAHDWASQVSWIFPERENTFSKTDSEIQIVGRGLPCHLSLLRRFWASHTNFLKYICIVEFRKIDRARVRIAYPLFKNSWNIWYCVEGQRIKIVTISNDPNLTVNLEVQSSCNKGISDVRKYQTAWIRIQQYFETWPLRSFNAARWV